MILLLKTDTKHYFKHPIIPIFVYVLHCLSSALHRLCENCKNREKTTRKPKGCWTTFVCETAPTVCSASSENKEVATRRRRGRLYYPPHKGWGGLWCVCGGNALPCYWNLQVLKHSAVLLINRRNVCRGVSFLFNNKTTLPSFSANLKDFLI